MSREERSLFDELLELAVYVPVGLASKALDRFPDLAEAGRARVGNQVDQARVIGRFAVGLARSRAARSFRPGAGRRRGPAAHDRAEPEPERRRSAPERRRSAPEPPRAQPSSRSERARPTRPGEGAAPPSERPAPPQAIPDYDALSASQVVPRLRGLDRDELGAVERYEEATRRRRTILNRIAQLQREPDDR